MSKYKLHPISAIIHFIKNLKEMIIPLIFIIFANGFSFEIDGDGIIGDLVPLIIMSAVLLYILFNGIIKWLTFQYWFENQELRIQYGLFVKKRRFIPFDRIQTLNYKESIFHRPFGLVLVTVETAASSGKAEAEFTAIKKKAAEQIEFEMNKAKGQTQFIEEEVEKDEHVIFRMSALEQITLATTSGGIGVIIFGVLTALSQFAQYAENLPVDWFLDKFSYFVDHVSVLITSLILIGLMIAWLLSVVWTMINYFDFKVILEQERIVITHGLLEKKRTTIPLNRVQAIQIIENPIRQALGFASVRIESAGGGEGEKGLYTSVKLFPLVKKKKMYNSLQQLFPHLVFDVESTKGYASPRRAKPFFYRLNFIWFIPVVAVASYYLFPYGFLSVLIAVPIVMLGIWRHKTARAHTSNNQITIVYRHFSKVTFIAERKRIQVMNMTKSVFQKRRGIASASVFVKSGMASSAAIAYHMEQQHIDQLLAWYEQKNDKEIHEL